MFIFSLFVSAKKSFRYCFSKYGMTCSDILPGRCKATTGFHEPCKNIRGSHPRETILGKLSLCSAVNTREHFLFYIKQIGFKNSGFLMEFWTLDGLERSGRPVGIISTYFRQKRSGGFRVMIKKPIIFTTIKFTSIKV